MLTFEVGHVDSPSYFRKSNDSSIENWLLENTTMVVAGWLTGPVSPEAVSICPATVIMFLRSLSASLVFVGVVVAAVNLQVQDSDSLSGIFAKAQVPLLSTQTQVTSARVDLSFCCSALITRN
jgi:hypothetical protein